MRPPLAPTRRLVASIQKHLAAIYRIEPSAEASQYLLGDAQHAHLTASADLPRLQGQLLVLEEKDEVWIGLYLDRRVRGALASRDPYLRLDARNLDPFLTAVEETSHFIYLLWSLGNGRPVSRFELELQGEVDKFASSALLMRGQSLEDSAPGTRSSVAGRLFGPHTFDGRLDAEEIARYRAVHRLAARYCRSLEARYLPPDGPARIPRLLHDLRCFYSRQGDA